MNMPVFVTETLMSPSSFNNTNKLRDNLLKLVDVNVDVEVTNDVRLK